MIGYTFSFEFLYESLHSLNNAPLIKKSSNHSTLEKASYGAITDKEKKPKVKITKNLDVVKDEHKSNSVLEEPSIPVLVYESNLNNENTSKTVITLFTDDDNSIETNKSIIDDEITKSVPELLSWIDSHKSISKSAATEWKKFIEKYLKYGNHSLIDIFNKVKNENLDKKLTAKMLIDLEKFYTQK
jgi:hypothetical protein